MNEASIERSCCRYAEGMGWIAMKIVSPNMIGVPDRLFIGWDGRSEWVEFKTPKGKLSAMQARMIKKFKAHGQSVTVIRSLEEFQMHMGYKVK